MAVKRKISIRKVLQVVTTFVATIACVTAMISASTVEGKKTLSSIQVHINSGKKYHFIEEKQILDETINNRNIDVMHIPISNLDIKSMEQVLKADPWVADASLYVDAQRVLHISVTQRIPIVRLFGQTGMSYYMDNTLNLMPLAPNFIYYTSVVTNVPALGNDSVSTSVKKQISLLVHNIQADTFWSAQVSQIVLDSDYSFELIPVLGQQRIIFGDTSRMKEKLHNLYTFYINVLNRIGWDKYEALDVRFKGQVVASPSLPYKGPVDKSSASMNWISSIVETEARIDSLHAQKTDPKEAQALAAAKKEEPAKPADKKTDAKKEKKDEKKHDAKEVKKEPAKDSKKTSRKDEKKDPKKEHKKDDKKAPKKEDKNAKSTDNKGNEPVKKDSKKTAQPKENKKEERKPKYTLPEHKEQ